MTYVARAQDGATFTRRTTGEIVWNNATAHFRMRASSWFMAVVMLAIGVVMTINPDGLTDNPGSAVYLAFVNRIAPAEVWRAMFLAIGTLRLCALIVNGSFRRVTWTPRLRAICSGISALIWFQFSLSIWATAYLAIATIVFPAIMIMEIFNTAVAASEIKAKPRWSVGG